MTYNHAFHRGIASGNSFCNRTEELSRIALNIQQTTHTLLISPRRYGKTSLALRAIEASKLPYAHIDLFMKSEAMLVTYEFYSAIGLLISKILKPTQKIIQILESFFKNISVSLKMNESELTFSLSPNSKEAQNDLKSLLMSVDELLIKYNKNAVIFIDEIQALSESMIADEVESALRFVAQKTKNISFIFSGSSRHLLSMMFENKSRPLYKLCHKISVQRISAMHYENFINRLAKTKWSGTISKQALSDIFSVTQCHPYYVNILCGYLFESEQIFIAANVLTCWEKICQEEQGSIAKDIDFLTGKQKKLLREIAKEGMLKEPTSKNFVKRVDLTPKGILGGITILLKHDLIEKCEDDFIRVVDPVLLYWLKR